MMKNSLKNLKGLYKREMLSCECK